MSFVENPDGVVGINWHRYGENTPHGIQYECRGIGPVYKRVYEWLNKSSYRCTGQDWPWDFFVFDDPKDHDRLIEKFGEHVSEYPTKEEYDELMKEDEENE